VPIIADNMLAIAKATHCNVFIESGTFYGQTFGRAIASGVFERCYSIEIQQHLHDRLQKEFLPSAKQQVFLGASYEQFKQSVFPLCTADDVLFFWLDGHFSAGETGGAEFRCPLIDELETIAASCPTKKVVIAIDDTDDLGRKDPTVAGLNWPTRAEIEAGAQSISPRLHIIDYTGSGTLPKINRGILIFSYMPVDTTQLPHIHVPVTSSASKKPTLWQRIRSLLSV
jgi:hypothetical protein